MYRVSFLHCSLNHLHFPSLSLPVLGQLRVDHGEPQLRHLGPSRLLGPVRGPPVISPSALDALWGEIEREVWGGNKFI